ncbi:MAG: pilus assembly protein [Acidimicrobiales bacterium]
MAAGLVLVAAMLAVQIALAYYAQQVMAGAAQDGAVAGARRDASVDDGRAVAADLVDAAGSSLLVSSSVDAAETDGRVTVTVSGQVVSLIPFRSGFTVSATSSAPVEQFRPQADPP